MSDALPHAMTSHPLILYGIPNCDQVKRARAWLQEHHITYIFHDYKKHGVPAIRLQHWLRDAGLTLIVNRQGTTWRKLTSAEQEQCHVIESALTVLSTHPSLIKRPILECAEKSFLCVGFDTDRYASIASTRFYI